MSTGDWKWTQWRERNKVSVRSCQLTFASLHILSALPFPHSKSDTVAPCRVPVLPWMSVTSNEEITFRPTVQGLSLPSFLLVLPFNSTVLSGLKMTWLKFESHYFSKCLVITKWSVIVLTLWSVFAPGHTMIQLDCCYYNEIEQPLTRLL